MVTETRVGLEAWPEAIARTDGYQLIVAGPGTGKSEFLARRVAHLLEVVTPREIIVLCFSRRAAATLRQRVISTAGSRGSSVDVTTFHSLALRLLESTGAAPSPLTTPEQIGFVARVLADEEPSDWPLTFRGILGTTAFAAEMADFLMRCSERLLDPPGLAELAESRDDWRAIPAFYQRYMTRLAEDGRTDYGVLLARAERALRADEVATAFRYVLIDEYQDTTPAQAQMGRHLAAEHGNLTVAGDPYQSIYSFRGAELRNVAEFTEDHPESERIVLTESLRVPTEILTAALRVVSGGHLPGAAGPVAPAPHPGRSETYIFDQETAEAEWIASEVERAMVVDCVRPAEIAVLVRSKREGLNELSRALTRRRIPHDPPQSRLVDHPAIRMVHDLAVAAAHGGGLRTANAVDAAAADRAMRRILLGPVFRLALGQERSLLRARRRTWEPWSHVVSERLPEIPGLAGLLADASWVSEPPAAEGFWRLWSTLDRIEAMVEDPARLDWRSAWAAFAQALGRQADRDAGVSLADYFALTEDEDFEAEPMLTHDLAPDRVTLTTMHQAKGLEFEIVFIANASEGVFPDLRRSRRMLRPEHLSPHRSPGDIHVFQLQEEMRLAYTAMTRARTRVVMTATNPGVDEGERRPSRFLVAVAAQPLDMIGPPMEEERPPVTVAQTEIMLRRWMTDPTVAAPRRLGAASVIARNQHVLWDASRFAGVSSPGPDRPLLGPTVRLSPSQAESYQTCPRQYALERRLRLGNNETVYSRFGILVHEVLHRAEAEVVGTGQRHAEPARVLEVLDEVWQGADFGTPQLDAAWRSKAAELLERLYGNWPRSGPPVAVERPVSLVIDGIPWHGKVDRVEREGNAVAIVDYKTGTTAVTKEEARSSVQLGFYALALEEEGEMVINAEFWFPRASGKSIPTRELDLSGLDGVAEELARVTRGVVAEEWAPRPGGQCDRCAFRRSCPAWPEGRGAFLP
jgi:superfamily I DNA/RNA helicase/CRISPR/Cas system-associated exonuclease Cas4 (RecB family)